MSLLEDLRHVLYVVLEYFGVPPDMVSALHISGIKGIVDVSLSVWFGALTGSWFQCGTVICVVPTAASCA